MVFFYRLCSYQVRLRLFSYLIEGISRVLQKLVKDFYGNVILTSFGLPSAGLFTVIIILNLDNSEFTIALAGSSP